MKMSTRHEKALNKFVSYTLESYPEDVKQIILFGSFARGEGRTDSDMDLLVLTQVENYEIRHALIGKTFDILLETGIDLSVKVTSEKEFKKHQNYSFYKNVTNDGVQVV
jgi:predicted nucleotidyltransferase